VIHALSPGTRPAKLLGFLAGGSAARGAGLSALSHLHYVRFGAGLTSLSRVSPPDHIGGFVRGHAKTQVGLCNRHAARLCPPLARFVGAKLDQIAQPRHHSRPQWAALSAAEEEA
jgi:hypothetical protein